jgi:homoserine kinase
VRGQAVKTRAPATTANLGPGFDCAAVALDLWNDVEVTEGGDEPPDPTHIGIRAFGLVASPEGLSFSWSERIRLERGDDRARVGRGGEVVG